MERKTQNSEDNNKNYDLVEKITFAFGILVLVVLIFYLIYHMNQDSNKPPELVVAIFDQPAMDHYSFKLEVENTGDQTAEAAQIKLSLYQNGEVAEDGTVQFQYLPMKSKETAWIVFQTEKKPNDSLVVSSITYTKP